MGVSSFPVMFLDAIGDKFPVTIATAVTTTLLVICLVLIVISMASSNGKHTNGLKPLPGVSGFAGYRALGLLKKRDFKELHKRMKSYGDIFSVSFGSLSLVIITKRELAEEAYVTNEDLCPDRGGTAASVLATVSLSGSRGNNGAAWLEVHQFDKTTILDPEFRRKYLSSLVSDAIDDFRTEIRDGFLGKAFNPAVVIQKYVTDVIARISVGHGFKYSDPKFAVFVQNIVDVTDDLFIYPKYSTLARMCPCVMDGCLFASIRRKAQAIARFIKDQKPTVNMDSDPSADPPLDIVDRFAQYIHHLKQGGQATYADEGDGWGTVMDFFIAGMTVYDKILRWHVLYMAVYKDVQESIRQEINTVTGGRSPVWDDLDNLPLTHSTLLELLRIRLITPLPHFVPQDGQLGEYRIPKGSVVFASFWAINFDPEVWDEPAVFNPRRFLDASGQIDPAKTKLFTPFSMGRRACAGRKIAMMSTFLHLARFVQEFDISLPPGRNVELDHEKFSFNPGSYQVIYNKVKSQ